MFKIVIILTLLFIGHFIYSIIYNFHSKKSLQQFYDFIKNHQPIILYDIKLKHLVFTGNKWLNYNDKFCNVFLMDDYVVLLSRNKLIFEIERFPLVIAKDCTFFKKNYPDFSTYKLSKVNMKHSVKKEFEIHYMDEKRKNYKGEIKFKDLSPEQKQQFQTIGKSLV